MTQKCEGNNGPSPPALPAHRGQQQQIQHQKHGDLALQGGKGNMIMRIYYNSLLIQAIFTTKLLA
jgi:hypothetical protein